MRTDSDLAKLHKIFHLHWPERSWWGKTNLTEPVAGLQAMRDDRAHTEPYKLWH